MATKEQESYKSYEHSYSRDDALNCMKWVDDRTFYDINKYSRHELCCMIWQLSATLLQQMDDVEHQKELIEQFEPYI
jgi:hypothetical protein